MTERVSYANHKIERRRIEVVRQVIPSDSKCLQRNAVLVSEFLYPADHPRAGVGGDNIQAETGEADRKLASPT